MRRKKIKPLTKFIIIVFAVIGALTVYFSVVGEGNFDAEKTVPTGSPISYIAGDCDIFTVIAVITGNETKSNIMLFMEVCGGFNIDAVFFMSTEYMDKSGDIVEKIYSEGHTVGLLCNATSKLTRSGFMKFLANRNDEFYAQTGRYPKYCYITGTPCQYASEVINAYGQYYVSHSAEITENRDQVIKNGYIVAVDLTGNDGVYAFVRAVSQALDSKLKAVSMKEFMKEYESIHES
ncbi:MAG: hypothetical protein PHW77_00025 [Eubacteriales bacterium]|nr:hypothetical protein [Eubacteriales bacterium]